MANPYKEAEKTKKTPPGSHQSEEKKKVETVHAEDKKLTEVKSEPQGSVVSGVLKAAKEKSKPKKNTVALYLSDSNTKWLKATAKKAGLSTSELLDQILTELSSQHE